MSLNHKSLLSLVISLIGLLVNAQDYTIYHKTINIAEEEFFIKNDSERALQLYDSIFNQYDFVFVKDVINAAQIAKFSKKPFRQFLKKGFELGLKIDHLKEYPLLNDYYKEIYKNQKFKKEYDTLRKQYLKKIDFDYLKLTYQLAIKDQINKHEKSSQFNYWKQVKRITDHIKNLTSEKGFPGDRLIGISDSTIFKEIGKPHLDLYPQRKTYKKLWYMSSEEKNLVAKHPLIIYLHNPCSFNYYKNLFIEEIKKGNIHPRDVALIHDHIYAYRSGMRNGCGNPKTVFLINNFATYPKSVSEEETNRLRKKFFIVSTTIDRKKMEYQNKFGFKLFSGVWNSR